MSVIALALFAAATGAAGGHHARPDAPIIFAEPDKVRFVPAPGLPRGTEMGVTQGDPATGAFDMYIRMQPGTIVPLHFHSASERSIVVQGRLSMRYQDGTTHVGDAGDFMYLRARNPHAVTCLADGPVCVAFFGFEGPFDMNWVEPPPPDLNPQPPAKPAARKPTG